MNDFWRSCTKQLRDELTPQQYNAWIKPLTGGEFRDADRVLRIGAPNRFKLDWVKNQFATRIGSLASDFFEGPVQLEFFLDPKIAEIEAPRAPAVAHRPMDAVPSNGSVPAHAGENSHASPSD